MAAPVVLKETMLEKRKNLFLWKIQFLKASWSKDQFKKKIDSDEETFSPHPNMVELSKTVWFLEQQSLFSVCRKAAQGVLFAQKEADGTVPGQTRSPWQRQSWRRGGVRGRIWQACGSVSALALQWPG